jgi:antitoxin MazE
LIVKALPAAALCGHKYLILPPEELTVANDREGHTAIVAAQPEPAIEASNAPPPERSSAEPTALVPMWTHVSDARALLDDQPSTYILVDTPRRFRMSKSATLAVQKWGNSLAVRIPAPVARSARLRAGQPVEVSVQDSNVLVRPLGEPRLTLAQKLAAFDPALHGGEHMPTVPVGREAM